MPDGFEEYQKKQRYEAEDAHYREQAFKDFAKAEDKERSDKLAESRIEYNRAQVRAIESQEKLTRAVINSNRLSMIFTLVVAIATLGLWWSSCHPSITVTRIDSLPTIRLDAEPTKTLSQPKR